MSELTVDRMWELEKMAMESNIVYPLSLAEWRYVERAEKIPYQDAKKALSRLGETVLPLGQIRYIYYLLATYNCTQEELNKRFEDVYRVKRYENMINTNLLNEQKNMVKRINKNR